LGRKTTLYASFGIRELWVIDAIKLTARVYREPAADGYRHARDFGAGDRIEPLFAPADFALRLDELDIA
jgi:Uma2 family endonuclease